MLRQIAPLALAIPPPSYIKFLPPQYEHDTNHHILAVSSNGYIQTLSLNPTFEPMMETLQIQYATLGDSSNDTTHTQTSDEVSVVTSSSSGQLIAAGSMVGVISLHAYIHSDDPMNIIINKVIIFYYLIVKFIIIIINN